MSLRAWAGLLGEFGRQSEMYAKRQQELEDKQAEEDRENRRMQALIAKEQGMARFNATLAAETAEIERNRPLSPREQEDRDQKKALVDAQVNSYNALASQRESKTVSEEEVATLAAQLSEQNGGDMVAARAQARALLSGGGRSSSSGKSGGADGALKLGNADLFKDVTPEGSTQTLRQYLNGSKVPVYTEDEFVQLATERTDAWRKQKGKGLLNSEPGEEETAAYLEEQLKALKAKNTADHKAAFEASKQQISE